MELARASVRQAARAAECLLAGADAERIHEGYVVRAIELLERRRRRRFWAASGHADAIGEQLIAELDALYQAIERAYPD
jgi:hypothetical protein